MATSRSQLLEYLTVSKLSILQNGRHTHSRTAIALTHDNRSIFEDDELPERTTFSFNRSVASFRLHNPVPLFEGNLIADILGSEGLYNLDATTRWEWQWSAKMTNLLNLQELHWR